MKKALAATALAATLLAGSAISSFAATSTSTTALVLNADGAASFNNSALKNTTFTDYYTFTLGSNITSAAASVTASFASLRTAVANFTVSLYQGVVGSGIVVPGTTTTTTTTSTSKADYVSSDAATFAPGKYYLAVSGTTSKNNGVTYGGSLSVNSVPLPSTVALFGVALAGLGVAGAMRRKSATSAA